MRKARVFVHGIAAGILEEQSSNQYIFTYLQDYIGPAVSITMPVRIESYEFSHFPPFFEGLLPEGIQLDALLRKSKLDSYDLLGQLIQVGHDMVGAITVEECV